jgi:hypothetical protein
MKKDAVYIGIIILLLAILIPIVYLFWPFIAMFIMATLHKFWYGYGIG